MPQLGLSDLNIVLTVGGAFLVSFGCVSHVIKRTLFLGEALPAVTVGTLLGPFIGKLIEPSKFGGGEIANDEEKIGYITLGLCRVVIGVQLVIAGFQLPKKYIWKHWRDMAITLIPLMVIMWISTSVCIKLVVPKVTFLASLVIGACVTCTDPVLSQAIVKGAFADKYVPQYLREIISSEAGANDGFGFPFLMLAIYIMRHNNDPDALGHPGEHGVGALGGGSRVTVANWIVEVLLYFVLLSVVFGAITGYASQHLLRFASRCCLIDSESYLLWALALGLFNIGVCGLIGIDDLLACFVCGCFLNWDGTYLGETTARHDEVNSSIDFLLNLGGFTYVGAVMPWREFSNPETGINYFTLVMVAALVLVFRRIPGVFMVYRGMPNVVKNWKDALFVGYFGPIGIGAVFYVEYAKHIIPRDSHGDEETNLRNAMAPVVYFLVLASIVVHGLSIPLLNIFYSVHGVPPTEHVVRHGGSSSEPLPADPMAADVSTTKFNRFSRPSVESFGATIDDKMSHGDVHANTCLQPSSQTHQPYPSCESDTYPPPPNYDDAPIARRESLTTESV